MMMGLRRRSDYYGAFFNNTEKPIVCVIRDDDHIIYNIWWGVVEDVHLAAQRPDKDTERRSHHVFWFTPYLLSRH